MTEKNEESSNCVKSNRIVSIKLALLLNTITFQKSYKHTERNCT